MCRRLKACVESPAAAQITVSTVHKAKGLEWPRVLMPSDFNQFVELEKGKPVTDMEEAYIMFVALTRAREKLILSPACVEAIAASAATKAGRVPTQVHAVPRARGSHAGHDSIEGRLSVRIDRLLRHRVPSVKVFAPK
jgi:superfamily I DNA/RNA helicase